MNWKIGVIITGLICLSIFIGQNYQTIEVKFLFWAFSTSRAIVLFLTLGLGFILGWVWCLLLRKKHHYDVQ